MPKISDNANRPFDAAAGSTKKAAEKSEHKMKASTQPAQFETVMNTVKPATARLIPRPKVTVVILTMLPDKRTTPPVYVR